MKNLFIFLFLVCTSFLKAQNKVSLYKDLSADDSTALLTVASYPDSVRNPVLRACQNPEVLVKAEALQKNTSQSFRDLLSNCTKEDQQKIWDLARYPGLIHEITNGGKKSKEQLESITQKYPLEIKKTIIESEKKHYDLLSGINALQENSQKEFETVIAGYPPQTQTAYRTLLNHPDVLNTLATNMHLSVIMGNIYKSDPQQIKTILDSARVEHEKQSAKDLEDWKNGLEKNPEAKKEMEDAAKEFTQQQQTDDYSYSDDIYNTGPSQVKKTLVYTSPPTITYVINPYPYWFGYPWWYDYPYWYPYPYWYNCGFYWGVGGMVYIGFPSPYFIHWYFYHPYHHYYYSHFSDYCVGYHYQHYGPRYQRTGFNSEIHRWARANEPNLPKGYFNNDSQRPERIKEFGKFEMDYHNNTKGVFGKNITRPEFLQNNAGYYPHINPVINQPRFNKPIIYPQQQNPVKFKMLGPGGNFPQPMQRGGGLNRPRR
jgi:hypothetical protein